MLVGNYIHYRFSNYREYGLGLNSGVSPNPNRVFANQKNKLLNSLPKRSAKNQSIIKSTLENQLNFFFNPADSKSVTVGYTQEESERIKQAVINICQQAISNLNTNDVTWDTLSVSGGGSVSLSDEELVEIKNASRSKFNPNKKSATTKGAVYRKLQILSAKRDQLADKASNSPLSAVDKSFIKEVNNFEKSYKKLIKELKDDLGTDFKYQEKKTERGDSFKTGGKYSYTGHEGFLQSINNLMNMAKKTTNTLIQGQLGEFIPVASQYVFNRIAQVGLEECLNELTNNPSYAIDIINGKIVGNTDSRKTISSEKVIGKHGNDSMEVQIGDVKVNTSFTKDKVDIILDLPEGKVINASMKNININNGIHLLRGTSSLKFLQEYPAFTNHYLNITANIGRDDPAPESLVQHAHNIAKMTIALHALIGGVWGEQRSGKYDYSAKAELLIINNTKGQRANFKVYFMSDIINTIIHNIKLVEITGLDEPQEYTNKFIVMPDTHPKNRVPDTERAFARVAKILAQLNTQKLEVQLSALALK